MPIPPFEPAMVQVKNGQAMLIRPLEKEEAPAFLAYIKKLTEVDRDFYDIGAARVYAEVLG